MKRCLYQICKTGTKYLKDYPESMYQNLLILSILKKHKYLCVCTCVYIQSEKVMLNFNHFVNIYFKMLSHFNSILYFLRTGEMAGSLFQRLKCLRCYVIFSDGCCVCSKSSVTAIGKIEYKQIISLSKYCTDREILAEL